MSQVFVFQTLEIGILLFIQKLDISNQELTYCLFSTLNHWRYFAEAHQLRARVSLGLSQGMQTSMRQQKKWPSSLIRAQVASNHRDSNPAKKITWINLASSLTRRSICFTRDINLESEKFCGKREKFVKYEGIRFVRPKSWQSGHCQLATQAMLIPRFVQLVEGSKILSEQRESKESKNFLFKNFKGDFR